MVRIGVCQPSVYLLSFLEWPKELPDGKRLLEGKGLMKVSKVKVGAEGGSGGRGSPPPKKNMEMTFFFRNQHLEGRNVMLTPPPL